MECSKVIGGASLDRVGSFATEREARSEAEYWRKRKHRARIVVDASEAWAVAIPYHLYVSESRRR